MMVTPYMLLCLLLLLLLHLLLSSSILLFFYLPAIACAYWEVGRMLIYFAACSVLYKWMNTCSYTLVWCKQSVCVCKQVSLLDSQWQWSMVPVNIIRLLLFLSFLFTLLLPHSTTTTKSQEGWVLTLLRSPFFLNIFFRLKKAKQVSQSLFYHLSSSSSSSHCHRQKNEKKERK